MPLAMQFVGPIVPPRLLPVVGATVLGCLATRCVVPFLLLVLMKVAQTAVGVIATVLVLPEYWLSTASRRRCRRPPLIAYNYGYAVGWLARVIRRTLDAVLSGMAKLARAIPLLATAVVSAAATITWLVVFG